ncbi:FAD-dependent monooxygenase [Halobacillus salinarum]|uniref:FAD-dependent monooxygenase n=1 Tax=Halobacillus salinarum TaxID=2932257 RepID=A0ABY4EFC6_9BACI|nr:FAD-dependent monooxygenase [Halobacillus salinarum]UOQ42829.1 FAD-dependent monooxygenase [Halobacillus salinarum]
MKETTMQVLIIGAGTGGLALAHALKKSGVAVSVYERDRTRMDGLQGYRVGISPDGSRALQKCLPQDLYDTFIATCVRTPEHFNMVTEKWSEVLSIPVHVDEDNPANSERSVSRMSLRQVLLTGLEEYVHFDKKFTHYRRGKDGEIIAYFEDGTSAVGTVLVGADGSNSRVRKQLLPHAQLRDTGIISIGGKVPLTEHTRKLLPEKFIRGITAINARKDSLVSFM